MALVRNQKLNLSQGDAATLDGALSPKESGISKHKIFSLLKSPESVTINEREGSPITISFTSGTLCASLQLSNSPDQRINLLIADNDNVIGLKGRSEETALKLFKNTCKRLTKNDLRRLSSHLKIAMEDGVSLTLDEILKKVNPTTAKPLIANPDQLQVWKFQEEDYHTTKSISSMNISVGVVGVKVSEVEQGFGSNKIRVQLIIPESVGQFLEIGSDQPYAAQGGRLMGEYSAPYYTPIHIQQRDLLRELRNLKLFSDEQDIPDYLKGDNGRGYAELLKDHKVLSRQEKFENKVNNQIQEIQDAIAQSKPAVVMNRLFGSLEKLLLPIGRTLIRSARAIGLSISESRLVTTIQDLQGAIGKEVEDKLHLIGSRFQSQTEKSNEVIEKIKERSDKAVRGIEHFFDTKEIRKKCNETVASLVEHSKELHFFYHPVRLAVGESYPINTVIALDKPIASYPDKQAAFYLDVTPKNKGVLNGKVVNESEFFFREAEIPSDALTKILANAEERIQKQLIQLGLHLQYSSRELNAEQLDEFLDAGVRVYAHGELSHLSPQVDVSDNAIRISGRTLCLTAHRNENSEWSVVVFGPKVLKGDSTSPSQRAINPSVPLLHIPKVESVRGQHLFDRMLGTNYSNDRSKIA